MSKFSAGQVWAYRNRPGEEASCVTVLRVDATEHAGTIVHVAVEGLAIHNPADPKQPTRTIGFMPLTETCLDQSVTHLLSTDAAFLPSADFEEGYRGWKEAFDSGRAGFWTAPLARIVEAVEEGLREIG